MSSESENFGKNLKVLLKARIRVPILLKSENLKYHNYSLSTLLEMKNKNQKPKKLNIHKNNYIKFTEKTNILQFVMNKMPMRNIYSLEKDCSEICDNLYERIINYNKPKKKLKTLQKIENKNSSTYYPKIKLKKLDTINNKNENTNNNITLINPYKNRLENYLGKIKTNSYSDRRNIKLIKRNVSNVKKVKNNSLSNLNSFFISNNITIIKGGGIKYNNSIFRFKNINQLV